MANILALGIATLDIINVVEDYPQEDLEVRALSQRVCRGGNATNTLVVLSQLGHCCSWGGVSVNEPDGEKIFQDLAHHKIDTGFCRIESQGKVPTSYILLNQRNGSRTIVHYRQLPEFDFTDFEHIDVSLFDWIHFEGRNVSETLRMLQRTHEICPTVPISVEVEKPRHNIEQLFKEASVLLFSRGFAQYYGYRQASLFLHHLRFQIPQADLICAWGDEGGFGIDHEGQLWHSPAYPPSSLIDTLGVGDTFNAGIIDSLCRKQSLPEALEHACRLAGKKCGQMGLENLGAE